MKSLQRNIICLFVSILFLAACGTNKEQKKTTPEKPNIIFIFADDQCHNTINALGNKDVITPTLDKMVESGVTFTHAYNMGSWTGAVCAASRAMLNTGLPVWQARLNDKNLTKPEGIEKTWGKLMEKQDYETYMTGKWHVHAPASKVFNHTTHVRGGMPKDGWDHATMVKRFKDLKEGKSKYKSYTEFMPAGYNRPLSKDDNSWTPTDTTFGGFWEGGQHWAEALRDDAIGFINDASKKDKPFFMYLAFNAPHDPRQAPQEYQDMYDASKLSIPENFQPLYPEREEIGNGPALRDAALAPFPRTKYATQVHMKEYYASITHVDAQIQKILDALEKSGKADNTYIIYTADHGLAVGNHGLFGKQNMYDHSMRPPFIVIGPNVPKNKKIDADIYLQDAMATALDLSGCEKPDYVFFNSVMPLATGATNQSAYPAVYGAYKDIQRMIRKDGYKLIVYPTASKIKLFDMKNDPLEMNDLASKKEYQTKVKSMFNDLMELQKNMQDPLDISGLNVVAGL